MPRRSPISDDQLRELAKKGMTAEEAAEELGVTTVTVYRRARQVGVQLGPPRGEEARRMAFDLHARGRNVFQIARALSCSVASAKRYLRMTGVSVEKSSPVDMKKAVSLFDEGMTIPAVAYRLQARVRDVHETLRRAGRLGGAKGLGSRGINREEVVGMYKSGLSIDMIAAVMQVGTPSIRYHLYRSGALERHEVGGQGEQVLALHDQGMSATEIAKETGLTVQGVRYHLLRAGGAKDE